MVFSTRLPPLQMLIVFESAARHCNFTAAARELGTTQSAVSQQVRALEKRTGLQLFERIYRGVELTDSGRALFQAVSSGLRDILAVLEKLQSQQQRQTLNVVTDFAFASYWLLPRLPQFRQRYPQLNVRILTSQTLGDGSDWPEADVHIGYLPLNPQHKSVWPLFSETVFPVCSPSLFSRRMHPQNIDGLTQLPLLSLRDESRSGWLDWSHFLAECGINTAPQPVLTFDNYTLLIQSVLAGQGVALGWNRLLDDLLNTGLLVALRQWEVSTRGGYFLRDLQPGRQRSAKSLFIDWLLECV